MGIIVHREILLKYVDKIVSNPRKEEGYEDRIYRLWKYGTGHDVGDA